MYFVVIGRIRAMVVQYTDYGLSQCLSMKECLVSTPVKKKTESSFHPPDAEFVRSYTNAVEMPMSESPEFALLGRSNVGKSSFLNHIFARKGLARVSKKPGKTRMANVYKTSEGSVWVDLPGYGYATAGRQDKQGWSKLIDQYCRKREPLAGILWLLDIRHPGMRMDQLAAEWLQSLAVPVLPIFTKSDKLSRNSAMKNAATYRKTFLLTESPVLFTITSAKCREDFWERFFAWKTGILG